MTSIKHKKIDTHRRDRTVFLLRSVAVLLLLVALVLLTWFDFTVWITPNWGMDFSGILLIIVFILYRKSNHLDFQ